MDVRVVSVGKARALITEEKSKGKRPKRKSPIIEQYEALLKGMGRRRSLLITLDENDKPKFAVAARRNRSKIPRHQEPQDREGRQQNRGLQGARAACREDASNSESSQTSH